MALQLNEKTGCNTDYGQLQLFFKENLNIKYVSGDNLYPLLQWLLSALKLKLKAIPSKAQPHSPHSHTALLPLDQTAL